MQRRIKQTYRDRKAGHLAKYSHKIPALQGQKFVESFLPGAGAVRQNHLAHAGQTFVAKKHVLSAAEADAFRAHLARDPSVMRSVGIRAHFQTAKFVGPFHQFIEVMTQRRLDRRDLAEKNSARRSVNCEPLSLGNYLPVDGELLLAVVDFQS